MDCPQVPFLGSGDESALKLAMALAFPSAPRLTCTKDLKQDFSNTLVGKVGLPKQERQHLWRKIFGDNGITVHAADHVNIADRLQHMSESIKNVSVQKQLQHLSSLLVDNAKSLERPGLNIATMSVHSGRTTIARV